MGAASEWGSPPCTVVTGSAPLWRLGLVGDGRVQGRAGDAALPMSRGSQNGGGGGLDPPWSCIEGFPGSWRAPTLLP